MNLAPGPEDRQSFLNVCLLEADSDVEKRSRRGKRRAIIISVVLQILFVAALILLPLFGKSENIAARMLIYPNVPYSPSHPHHVEPQRPVPRSHVVEHILSQPRYIPDRIVERDPTPPQIGRDPNNETEASRFTTGNDNANRTGIPFVDSTPGPKRPEEPPRTVKPAPLKVSGQVQEAKLIHRIQPVYPPLAVQLHREGRVEMHAIIATDGSIQSLEVLSGDPLLIQSALAAVDQWHYRPTTLNGQPVEVDTHITVIYTLSH